MYAEQGRHPSKAPTFPLLVVLKCYFKKNPDLSLDALCLQSGDPSPSEFGLRSGFIVVLRNRFYFSFEL